MTSRFNFVIAGLCYKILRSIQKSSPGNASGLAVFANDDLGLRIVCLGEFEFEILSYLRETFCLNIETSVFIDIGANVGNHTIGLCDHFLHCHAFEPDPKNFCLLEVNTAQKQNITCYPLALSDRDGISKLRQDPFNTGKSHIVGNSLAQLASEQECLIEVETKRLDSERLVSEPISLIKIDVEGHELQVLQGARQLLIKQKPAILIEQLAEDIRDGRSASLDFLQEVGYTNFYYFQCRYFDFTSLPNLAVLNWPYYILLGLETLVRGRQNAKLVKLDISRLKVKNYDAILVYV